MYIAAVKQLMIFYSRFTHRLKPFWYSCRSNSPGLVETEFSEVRFKGDKKRAKSVYKGIDALTAEEVADAIIYMAKVPEKVTIADMVILPTRQANAYINNRMLGKIK